MQERSKPRILVAEDHAPLRRAICKILEKEGYTVLAAGNGAEALALMEQTPCDLILADIMMPEMDGYALYQAVRAHAEWATVPFVFLTARAEKDDVLKGKRLGAEDYITKPFDPQELLIVVRARLERGGHVRQAARAEFEQLKTQIITILGHELRTPLTFVMGYTDLALEEVATLPPAEMERFLHGIQRGTERLNRLVEDLLMALQLDSGQAERAFQKVAQLRRDLDAVVERAVQKYAAQAANRQVTMETEKQGELPPVRLSEEFFADALGRLIDNAIKFSPPGGRVRVTTRTADGWAEIAVADEGIGIAAEEIPHIFERFHQIGREQIEQQGVGLGLSIARDLIRLHGGEIVVDSQPGAGSTFTIRLPAAPPPLAEQSHENSRCPR